MNSVRVLPSIAAASSISCRVLPSIRRLMLPFVSGDERSAIAVAFPKPCKDEERSFDIEAICAFVSTMSIQLAASGTRRPRQNLPGTNRGHLTILLQPAVTKHIDRAL